MSDEPEIERKVYRLEWRVDRHDQQLTQLHSDNQKMDRRLESIDKRLLAIFWAVVGAGLMVVSSELGLVTALKAFL
ncbi:MAG TPA: hypothetical protein VK991_12940 [Halomonas sp.]|nr:hypothetical protein [Halomonas sp.]